MMHRQPLRMRSGAREEKRVGNYRVILGAYWHRFSTFKVSQSQSMLMIWLFSEAVKFDWLSGSPSHASTNQGSRSRVLAGGAFSEIENTISLSVQMAVAHVHNGNVLRACSLCPYTLHASAGARRLSFYPYDCMPPPAVEVFTESADGALLLCVPTPSLQLIKMCEPCQNHLFTCLLNFPR